MACESYGILGCMTCYYIVTKVKHKCNHNTFQDMIKIKKFNKDGEGISTRADVRFKSSYRGM